MSAPSKYPPALILCAQIAGLALGRRLGREGIQVGMIDPDPDAIGFHSRYCRLAACAGESLPLDSALQRIEMAGDQLGPRPALLATSDEMLLLVSRNRERLSRRFRILLPGADLLETLIDKRRMRALATEFGVPAPRAIVVQNETDLLTAARELGFPCLVKTAYSKPTGRSTSDEGKIKVKNVDQLKQAYDSLAPFDARILIEEYLAGGCELVHLYNAYFDAASRPVAVFTGRKLRQYPIQYGTACLSECRPNPELALLMTEFFQAIKYCGPVDVGLKFDPRDGRYKVLDINPRLGQNYRTYVADDGSDLGWLAYQELVGLNPYRPGPWRTTNAVRSWMIEDNDWRTTRILRQLGELSYWDWIRSLLRVREAAYFDWRDPRPIYVRFHRVRQNRKKTTESSAVAVLELAASAAAQRSSHV